MGKHSSVRVPGSGSTLLGLVVGLMRERLASLMVLPHRIAIQLAPPYDYLALKWPPPEGRLHVRAECEPSFQ